MRDYRKLLRPLECDGEELLFTQAEPAVARQHRPELLLLCAWMEKKEIKSFLELGFYRGGLISTLTAIFGFERVAGADAGVIHKERGLDWRVPKRARVCWAKTESPEYRRFRHELGKMDLVFIDADHSYGSVRQDYEREKKQPHRFLAFHDIKNVAHAPGVVRLWNEIGGKKRELYVPREDGRAEMGIGLWSQKETP